jgi:hypothetical protein
MVDVVDAIGLVVILGVNSAVAAVMTRFFRVRLDTDWGTVLYLIFFGPIVLLLLTLVFSGLLGLGPNIGVPALVIVLTIVLPLSIGISFDFFWMPAPEEVDLPDRQRA